MHRIAITQIRLDGLGQAYYRNKRAEGITNPEALRRLKRRLVRVVFGHLNTDQHPAEKPITKPMAAAA